MVRPPKAVNISAIVIAGARLIGSTIWVEIYMAKRFQKPIIVCICMNYFDIVGIIFAYN